MPSVSRFIEVDSSTLGTVTVDLETGQWFIEGKEYDPSKCHYSLEGGNELKSRVD